MKNLVDRNKYFTISHPRQYGKTTAISLLSLYLSEGYLVFSISLEGLPKSVYQTESRFCAEIYKRMAKVLRRSKGLEHLRTFLESEKELTLSQMTDEFEELCEKSAKPVVLMIDEVDNASDSDLFSS
jgi:predicted AAA+ superfamily ATPase